MATKTKESTLRKEKKVTPSSNSHTIHRHGSPNSTIPGSTDKDKSTVSSKPIPNYLKPTFSSRSESLKHVKKTGHDEPTQKHTLVRRRSFDRPPVASRIHKSLISPDPKDRAGSRDRILTVRSTPLSSKTTSSPKPALDRASTSPKPIKFQPSAAKTIKRSSSLSRSTSPSTKNETHASVPLKDPSSHDITQTFDLETEQESNKEFLVHEAEEMVNVKLESEVLVPFDVPKRENKEDIDAINTQVNDEEDEKLKAFDICTVSKGQSVFQAAQVEETEQELHEEDGKNENEGEENHSKDEGGNSHPEEGIADEAKVESDEEKEEENGNKNGNENAASFEQPVDEKKHEDIKGNEVSEEVKSKEGEDVEKSVKEGMPEAANMAQKLQGGQVNSKKESPAAYNDVIEETKNKLLEKRKNKVKALVGAFETVIDYESAASK